MSRRSVLLVTVLAIALPGTGRAVILVDVLDTPGRAKHVEASDGLVYVAAGAAGQRILDPSVPGGRELGSLETGAEAEAVELRGGLAYVAANQAGLLIVDVSDPGQPSLLASFDTPGQAQAVAFDGSLAYVADGSAGLAIVDVSDPAGPQPLGSFDTPGDTLDVEVRDGLAYLADGLSGLRIVDVSDPAAPAPLSALPPRGFTRAVELAGPLAYVTADTFGVQILDVSNPVQPFEVSHFDVEGVAWDVAVRGDFAFVASLQGGVTSVDVSAPATPAIRVHFGVASAARDVAVDGTRLYVADNLAGLRILDVTWPATPSVADPAPAPLCGDRVREEEAILLLLDCGFPRALVSYDLSAASGPVELDRHVVIHATAALDVRGIVYVWGSFAALRLVDARDPARLEELLPLSTPGPPSNVVASGARLFVGGPLWLRIYDVADPAQPRLFAALPHEGFDRVDGTVLIAGTSAFDLGPEYASQIEVVLARDWRVEPQGFVHVALLGAAWLDAASIELETVRLHHAGAILEPDRGNVRDTDGDGRGDLVLRVPRPAGGIEPGSDVCLLGETSDDVAFYGCATVPD